MIVRVTRSRGSDDALPGALIVADPVYACNTLERASRAIPAGSYPLRLTYSGRAASGSLWTPRGDAKLLEVCDVPGRSGIRVHAANWAQQLEGCIAVGKLAGVALHDSRAALRSLMELLGEEEHTIEVA